MRACLLLVAGLAASSAALAHGGLHQSLDLVLLDGAPIVVTTYGLIRRGSDGAWEWVCEEVSGSGTAAWTFSASDAAWTMATIEGVVWSEAGCSWALQSGGPLDDVYVTEVAPDPVRGGHWAITGAGDAENPLYRSEDGARTWAVGPSVHPTARMRGLEIEADGRMWLQGMDGEAVWVWTSADGASWTGAVLIEPALTARLYRAAGGVAWVVTTAADGTDTLWRVPRDGAPEPVLEDGALAAVDAGPDPDEVWVSGPGRGTSRSLDGGQTWEPVWALGDATCLVHDASARWACTDNWGDGAAVRTAPLSAPEDWSDVLWFGDVHRIADCPADSTVEAECAPIWADLDPESGFDLVRAADSGADTGGPPAGSECGCGGGGAVLLLPLLGLGARRRRSAR